MIRKLQHLLSQHPTDGDLTLFTSDELPAQRRLYVAQHLATCRKCWCRRQRLEHAVSLVLRYLNDSSTSDPARLHHQRQLLIDRLAMLGKGAPNPKKAGRASSSRRAIPAMSPILAFAMVFAFASVTCVFVWLWQTRPQLTSNALLVRAEAWDPAAKSQLSPGVIRQTVRIQTPNRRLERTIYRDSQGRRRIKAIKLSREEEELKTRLAQAGVSWDAPLSAICYQDWHDQQRERQDQIRRSGRHLLVLTTTTPNGEIAAQSLTVRDTDFHPVGRSVSFRDSETVEIAELDYRLLPWSAASSELFEPEGTRAFESRSTPPLTVMPSLPALPSEAQLDEAELGARLVLNELRADVGEQIQIVRSASAVEVKGLVETEQRRDELVHQLNFVPRVKTSILSMEELKRRGDRQSGNGDVATASVSAQLSPLEASVAARGWDGRRLRTVSQNLLSSALTASQESEALTELLDRFPSESGMTPVAQGTLLTLVFSHRMKLAEAVEQEQKVLDELAALPGANALQDYESREALPLAKVAERNLALCEELSFGSNSQTRSAETILLDLKATVAALREGVRQAQVHSGVSITEKERK